MMERKSVKRGDYMIGGGCPGMVVTREAVAPQGGSAPAGFGQPLLGEVDERLRRAQQALDDLRVQVQRMKR
jgi:hypothetical protein